jgi:hypothetical protein
VASPDRARARHVVPGSRDELGVGGRGDRSVWPVVLVSPRPFFGTGGPSRCGWRTRPRSRRATGSPTWSTTCARDSADA